MKKKRGGYVPMRSLMLRALVGAGVISTTLLAPKMTRLLKEFDRPAKSREELRRRLQQAARRLEAAGLVKMNGVRGAHRLELTTRGRELAESLELGEHRIPEPAFWDGKWRIIAFDVIERRRQVRDQLRRMIQGAGFVRLQDSLWVYPYSCDAFIALIRTHLKSGVGELRSFVAESLESDALLRSHFRL